MQSGPPDHPCTRRPRVGHSTSDQPESPPEKPGGVVVHDRRVTVDGVTAQYLEAGTGPTRSQRGNHALKSALFLSAFASLADPTSRAYDDRKRAQGKRHNAALVCLARRRIDVIYAMLRDRKSYQQHAPATPEPSPAAA